MIGHLAGKTYETRGGKDSGLCREGLDSGPGQKQWMERTHKWGMKLPLQGKGFEHAGDPYQVDGL